MLAGFWWYGFAGLFLLRFLVVVTLIWIDIMKRIMFYFFLLVVSCSVSVVKYFVLIESLLEKVGFNVEWFN